MDKCGSNRLHIVNDVDKNVVIILDYLILKANLQVHGLDTTKLPFTKLVPLSWTLRKYGMLRMILCEWIMIIYKYAYVMMYGKVFML